MFKRKYLKQLQDVQARITACKLYLIDLEPPEPNSIHMSMNMRHWLDSLTSRLSPGVDKLLSMTHDDVEEDTYKYIHQLGEFFINISDYYLENKKYTDELQQLQKEERVLKDKLGIY